MLYKFEFESKKIEPLDIYDFQNLEGKEKDLEKMLVAHINELFIEGEQLMPFFQERQWQEEPDICALNKNGDLVIFELKRSGVSEDTTVQILRYSQLFGRKSYSDLDKLIKAYKGKEFALAEEHAKAFQLDSPLHYDSFNRRQKLIIVGSSSDHSLMEAVDYWKSQQIDIDFLPYRFYKIGDDLYFEFFAKPYDYHINPKNKKGIMFDTNKAYDKNSVWEMFEQKKISAYGNPARFIDSFNHGDYVLYYHIGYGIIAAGRIKSGKTVYVEAQDEKYRLVDFVTPTPSSEATIKCISPSEISQLLGKNFYYAATIKSPFLSVKEAEKLIVVLNEKYDLDDQTVKNIV